MKLDQNIKSTKDRVDYLNQHLDELNKASPQELIYYANYLLFAEKDKKDKSIITDNRNITLKKHETSFEGICAKLENGENGIYNLVSNLGKQAYLTQQKEITEEDIENVPGLKELRETIKKVEKKMNAAPPGKKHKLLKQLIDLRQLQYVLKSEYNGMIHPQPNSKTIRNLINFTFDEKIAVDENNDVSSDGLISLFNPKHISAILCNYSKLKEDNWDNFKSDSWYLMLDFDNVASAALSANQVYESIVTYKIDGKKNSEIQDLLKIKYGLAYSAEYISSLWRQKIPKLIAEKAKEEYLEWHYTFVEYGKWKKCSVCGQIKLADNRYFSKNNTSKDGLYSICKVCRNARTKKKGGK